MFIESNIFISYCNRQQDADKMLKVVRRAIILSILFIYPYPFGTKQPQWMSSVELHENININDYFIDIRLMLWNYLVVHLAKHPLQHIKAVFPHTYSKRHNSKRNTNKNVPEIRYQLFPYCVKRGLGCVLQWVTRHALHEYRKDERQQGADRHWWGEEVSKPDTASPLAGWSPSPPASQVAFSGNIKAFPHQVGADKTLSVVGNLKSELNVREKTSRHRVEGSNRGRGITQLPLFHSSIQHRQSPADGSHNEKPGWDGLVKESLCFYLQAHPRGSTEMGGLTW